ncbi:ig-like domain-containing protein [Trichonephila clavipes]|nr:ig-like domain-containing protein [Trichonephila clavipes]
MELYLKAMYFNLLLQSLEPPEFVTNMTNRNVTVMENSNVTLSCKATGNPPPVIKWKREDGQPFLVDNELASNKIKGQMLSMVVFSERLGILGDLLTGYMVWPRPCNDLPPNTTIIIHSVKKWQSVKPAKEKKIAGEEKIRGTGGSSGVVLVSRPSFKITRSVANSSLGTLEGDVNKYCPTLS